MVFSIKGFFKWGTRQASVSLLQSEQQSSFHIEARDWKRKEVNQVTQSDIVKETTIDMLRNRF